MSTIYNIVTSWCSWLLNGPPREDVFQETPIMEPSNLSPLYPVPDEKVPPIPEDLLRAWNEETCPFWPEKKVRETHLLILIPGSYKFETLIENAKIAFPDVEDLYKPWLIENVESVFPSSDQPYWALITKKRLYCWGNVESKNQSILSRTNQQYRIVNVKEATLSVLAAALHQVCIFEPDPKEFTCCQEVLDRVCPFVVGRSIEVRLCFSSYLDSGLINGAAAVRTTALNESCK